MSTDDDIINPQYCPRCHKATSRAELGLHRGMCFACRTEVDRTQTQMMRANPLPPALPPQPPMTQTCAPTRQKNDNIKISFAILAFLIPIAGIILGLVFLARKSDEDRETGRHTLIWAVIGFVCAFFCCNLVPGMFLRAFKAGP
ncbi:MAG: pilin [Armatimonadota bacterium]